MVDIQIDRNAAILVSLIVIASFIGGLIVAGGKPGSVSFQQEKLEFSGAVGKRAPDFSLDSNLGSVNMRDYLGKTVVLFFAEGAMCYPSCWDQMAALAEDPRLNNEKVISLSVVVDGKKEWDDIIKKVPRMGNAHMIFDTERKASGAYDVLSLESSMHRGAYPGHTYFIVDKNGFIRYAFDDPNMGVRNDLLAAEISKIS
ncbi:MAG: redoxin domain-containing protein [Candidatus Aenigmarchaeota archaeon]|nr:redoxin domain-containing protein [Candidatus Aenigmarchaeota archaeon]